RAEKEQGVGKELARVENMERRMGEGKKRGNEAEVEMEEVRLGNEKGGVESKGKEVIKRREILEKKRGRVGEREKEIGKVGEV
ncbi:hypothetical protein, partial [Bacillus sp. WP8]|uniref:hypothetical protein n=1 Tax=Bacillus sp. WP8 TaxID=756828 RepID=UPI001642BB95